MKRIIFLRHAKAVPGGFDQNDYDRPINTKGRNGAKLVMQHLLKNNIKPETIITSSAVRAYQTSTVVVEELGLNPAIVNAHDKLYDFIGVGDIQDYLLEVSPTINTVMFVGHNPWISSMCERFSKKFYQILPTSAAVVIDFEVSVWDQIEPSLGNVSFFEYPKKYA